VLLQRGTIIEYLATWFKVASKCSLLRLLNDLNMRDPGRTARSRASIPIWCWIPLRMAPWMRNPTVGCPSSFSNILPFLKTSSFWSDLASFFSSSSLELIWTYSRAKDTAWPYYIIANKFKLDAEKKPYFSYIRGFCRRKYDRPRLASRLASSLCCLRLGREARLHKQCPSLTEWFPHQERNFQGFISLHSNHAIDDR